MTPETMLTFECIEQPITEWALDYGIAPGVIIGRLQRGLPVEQAITTPMVTARGQKLKGKHLDNYIASQRYVWQRERRAVGKKKRCAKVASRPARKVRRFTFDGKTMTLPEWSQEIGISVSTLQKRVYAGWPIERILSPNHGNARHSK